MKGAIRSICLMLVFLSMGISGCVSTTMQTDWKDPAFSGKFKKVLVICVVKEMVVRNTLEDDLTAQFRQRGVAAVQSYTLFPSLENIDKEIVRAKVREIAADGVLLVRRTGKQSMETVSANYYDLWNVLWTPNPQASQANTVDFYRVETSLYEATKGGIVWQALSETFDDDLLMKVVNNFALLVAKKLSEQGLI